MDKPAYIETHIDVILRSDIEKYVGWLLNQKSTPTFRAADLKEPGLASLPSNPKENFPYWRKTALDKETQFLNWKYENSILPKDAIREREIERICISINEAYPLEIECLTEGFLCDRFYEMANLIGKIDYLKSLDPADNFSADNQVVQAAKNVVSHAIKHVYIAKAGGPAVTRTNKDSLAKSDGCAGSSLLKQYTRYSVDSNRLNLTEMKRSDGQLVKNFAIAVDMLKENQAAYDLAKKDFDALKKKFNSRYL